jgi:hypothetical protein
MPYDPTDGQPSNREATDRARQKLFNTVYESLRPRVLALVRAGDHDGAWDLLCDGPDIEGRALRWVDGQHVGLSAIDRVDISRRLHERATERGFDQQARWRVAKMVRRIIETTDWTVGKAVRG